MCLDMIVVNAFIK